MFRFIIGLLFLFATSQFVAQSNCKCESSEKYIKARDIDSIGKYKAADLIAESTRFLSNKSARCRAFGYHLKGQHELNTFQFEEAKLDFEREKYLLDSLRCKGISYIENNIGFGDYYSKTGGFQTAASFYGKALAGLSKNTNRNLQVRVLIAMSFAQSKLNQENRSILYLQQADPIVRFLPDGPGKVDNLFGLSARYFYHSNSLSTPEYLDSANSLAAFGLQLAKRIGYKSSFVKGYNLLENKAYHEHNFRVALLYLDSALLFTQPNAQFNDREGIFSDMSDIYLELKKYDKAYQFADSSLVYALKLGDPYKVKSALELVYNTSKLSGDYERALSVFEDLGNMQDSILKLESEKAYSQLEEKYHRERQAKTVDEYEQDKKLLQQQQQIGKLKTKLITVGIVIFALLSFYIFIVFRQKKIKQNQKKLEIQSRLNRARINPDFIYNALSNLQKTEGNSGDFSRKLAAFSKLMKQTLDSSHDDFLTLDREIEFLTTYLELQRDRLKRQFEFQFEVDEQIDPSNVCLPTMILQPFIESTVEQGFKNLKHLGQLTIQIRLLSENELQIKIQDNGLGLKAVDSARATSIIKDRLYLLNKMNTISSSYLIRERSSGGVSVEIFLPLITKAFAEKLKQDEV